MTPADNPPDSPNPRWSLAGPVLALVLLAGGAIALSSLGGCSKPPTPLADDQGTGGEKADAWKAASARLQKDTDAAAAKVALGALGGEKLPATPDEQFAAIEKLVPLTQADRDEIRGPSFSAHDAVYLADCFFLRDAARSLALAGVPPEQQADLAFAWVCRQVYLYPWSRPLGGSNYEPTALPPTAVLRRGFGSGLERAYVFLALLQQIGLDGCLIGGPDSGTKEARDGPQIAYPHSAIRGIRGPFWAVGVRIGTDVRLFDPWRGQAFPVTLNQLKANPDAAKGWFEARENLSGSTLEDAKKATVFLAVPVNALSARMAVFEAKLRAELGVKVALDLKALEAMRAAFPDPKPTFWNTPNGPYDYGRVARSFLPREQGGADSNPPGTRLYDAYVVNQIPADALSTPEGLTPRSVAASRLQQMAAGALAVSFIEPPNPRERIQRGQFQDAARDLVAKQDLFANGLERLRVNRDADQQIREWIARVDELYQEVGTAQLNKNKEQENAALAAVEQHWKQPGATLLIDQASAQIGRAEASLLLAQCKHEQAERLQSRSDRATGAEAPRLQADALGAWKTALSAWRTYEHVSSAHAGFPGRAAHGQALAARAAQLAEAKPKKEEPKKK